MLFCSSVATDGSATTVGSIASLTVRRSTAARCTSVKTSAVITAVTAANNTNCLPDTRYISKPSFARRSGAMPSTFQISPRAQALKNAQKDAPPADLRTRTLSEGGLLVTAGERPEALLATG